MNTRRKILVTAGASALCSPFVVLAQQPGKVWRIGYLDFGTKQSMVDAGRYTALIEGLRERGYIEGRNFLLEARFTDGNTDQLNEFAAELVRQKVDVILTFGTPTIHAAKHATDAIPIIVIQGSDPVGEGFAASLARPGANITGMTSGLDDTANKLVELLIIAFPNIKRIAVLSNPANAAHSSHLANLQIGAQKAGRQVLPVNAGTSDQIERGFATMVRERADAVIILLDSYLFSQRKQIAGLALKHRLPSIHSVVGYAEAGGLMSYGLDQSDNFRRAGIFVDKILKGAKPGDIPFEQPTRYYLVINRKTANALGIKPNNELLARADRVIE
jgi:putative ABC transport system substrate-binding protein